MIKGKDIVLTVDGENVAASSSCNITVDQEFIEVASPTDGRAKRVMPSKYAWSVSLECLCNTMVDADTFMQFAVDGTPVTLSFYDIEGGCVRRGTAYVQNVSTKGSISGLASLQVSLQGSGTLEQLVSWLNSSSISTGRYITHADTGFLYGDEYEDDEVAASQAILTKTTTVRLKFGTESSVDVLCTTYNDLYRFLGTNQTSRYVQARVAIVSGKDTTKLITLKEGSYFFVWNDGTEDVKVGVPVNPTTALSE